MRFRGFAAILLAGAALRLLLALVVFPGQGYTGDLSLFARYACGGGRELSRTLAASS